MTGLRVIGDGDKCIASGQCGHLMPDVFDNDDDGIVVVTNPHPDPAFAEGIRHAVEICPAQALSLTSDEE